MSKEDRTGQLWEEGVNTWLVVNNEGDDWWRLLNVETKRTGTVSELAFTESFYWRRVA